MPHPITVPWFGVGADPFRIASFDVSPDDRFAIALLHGARPFLRVIEMTSGEVVKELKLDASAVRFIAPDLVLCANAPAGRLDLEVVRITTGEVVTRWSEPRRNTSQAPIGLETSHDGRHGLVHTVVHNGPLHALGGFSRIETSGSQIAVSPIEISPRASRYGHSAQRKTRIEVERRSGMALVAHQADVNAAYEAAVIDLRTGAVSRWVQTRSDLGPHQPLPRWITPALLMFGDTPTGYDGTRVWLTSAPPGEALRQAILPRALDATEPEQALASLRHSTLHRDGRRVYGVHPGHVDGAWCSRAWVTDVSNDLRAEPVATWKERPEELTWVGEGVLAKVREIRPPTPLAFRKTPCDEHIVEVARPSDPRFAGFVTGLSVSPAGNWVVLRMEARAAAWVAVDALTTAR